MGALCTRPFSRLWLIEVADLPKHLVTIIHPHLNTPTNRRGVITRTDVLWTLQRVACSYLFGLLF